ncbi:Chordin-like protein 1, partial [Stegodyphus mimosarum]
MNPFPVFPPNHGMNQSINTSPQNAAHVSQILLLLLIGVLASLGAPPPTLPSLGSLKTRCTIANQEYGINETWYKYLRTPNANLCVRCLCKSDGASSSINCVNITCDTNMCAETKKDACCDICQGSSEEVKLDQSLNTDTKSEDSKLPCLHNGRVYQHGEEFSSNATGLQAQKPNQCIHCMCQTGLVLCRLRNCDSLQCLSSDTKDCCPTCK